MFGAANRDESTFGNSEAFDPTRDNLKEHIALGKAIISASGLHCLVWKEKLPLKNLFVGSNYPHLLKAILLNTSPVMFFVV